MKRNDSFKRFIYFFLNLPSRKKIILLIYLLNRKNGEKRFTMYHVQPKSNAFPLKTTKNRIFILKRRRISGFRVGVSWKKNCNRMGNKARSNCDWKAYAEIKLLKKSYILAINCEDMQVTFKCFDVSMEGGIYARNRPAVSRLLSNNRIIIIIIIMD